MKKSIERKLLHNQPISHKERMSLRREGQRKRLPSWAVGLIAAFGLPAERNEDFWNERNK